MIDIVNIKYPKFLSGTPFKPKRSQSFSDLEKRSKKRNSLPKILQIKYPFRSNGSPAPIPFDLTDEKGQLVRLSDKQLGTIDVPIRNELGQIIRYEKKPFNFGKALEILKNSIPQNIQLIQNIVNETKQNGKIDIPKEQEISLTLAIETLLKNVDSITDEQLEMITDGLNLITVSDSPRKEGIPAIYDRYVDKTVLHGDNERGALHFYILAQVSKNRWEAREGRSFRKPVIGIKNKPITVATILTNINNRGEVLDLKKGKMYTTIPKSKIPLSLGAEKKELEGEIMGHRQNLEEAMNNLNYFNDLPEEEKKLFLEQNPNFIESNQKRIRDSNNAIEILKKK